MKTKWGWELLLPVIFMVLLSLTAASCAQTVERRVERSEPVVVQQENCK